ncbi:hypothetical protein BGZ65_008421 [Modicella reniformis]|uniref:Uncharacterized protein n=1 Tax=Modicella reniformis TaxID=1440133 RepID=A0A9P6IIE5_9FUNG|nr:hypothetical protein BGZ65_008421 [Modicella reniformis]
MSITAGRKRTAAKLSEANGSGSAHKRATNTSRSPSSIEFERSGIGPNRSERLEEQVSNDDEFSDDNESVYTTCSSSINDGKPTLCQ